MAQPALLFFVATSCLLASPAAWAGEPANATAGPAVAGLPADAAPSPVGGEAAASAAPNASADDTYLDADFPQAKTLSVEPPIVGGRRSASPAATEGGSTSYPVGDETRAPEGPPKPTVVERGPFLGVSTDLFFTDYFNFVGVGVTGGTYLAQRIRIAAYLGVPFDFEAEAERDSYVDVAIDDPRVLFGGSFGIALARRRAFALSLATDVSTTDSSDLGWNIGLSVPMEWVGRSGFRVMVSPGLFQNVGSSNALHCETDYDLTACTSNDPGPATMGLHLQGGIGMTFK